MGNSEKLEPQVVDEMSCLGVCTVDLIAILRTLENKLAPVLQPEFPMPKDTGGNGIVEKSLVPLAEDIRGNRYRVNEATIIIGRLISRLEL